MQTQKSSSVVCAVLSVALATCTLLAPQVHGQQTTNAQSLNTAASALVQGVVTTTTGAAAGTFSGLLKITNFAVQNGQVVANGLLTGTITNANGTTSAVNQMITAPLASASGSCPILSLSLGPLHLNVLGLVIDLNQINLNIVAQPGNGNLLGNLLCDVANLLNNGGPLSTILSDLNNLLRLL